ncbi:dynamin family protein [Marimonas arenosa]|uniref:Dynamin family protein n=1 Tax=Marimonas arenosa TaxID=1795305 RepID=A0AAE4B4B9_9RHOB|nr:dynamin family protein [Marimonas arenosa]MDQ2090888.1 dynamin family protein [Marimonas arenosa]
MNIEADIVPTTEIRASARPTNLRAGMDDLAAFADRARQLGEALDSLSQVAEKGAARSVKRLKDQLDEFEPSVTILGQVKSGKTSLINAMAGWADLLPADVNPWTSVVTSLHLEPGRSRKETGARFQFMAEDEWNRLTTKGGRMGELAGRAGADSELQKLQAQVEMIREKSRARLGRNFELLMGQKHEYGYFDKNLLERYICLGDDFDLEEGSDAAGTGDEQGRFADITRSADLYLNCQTVPFRMCLRDTPGVNDTFLLREQITIKAVRDSRLCVVVLSAGQALTSVDMGLIRLISNLNSRDVIIFVNRIDELPDPANQIAEIEDSIRQTLKDHHGPHDTEIVFGSAYWANKALTGELQEMTEDHSKTLLDWAAANLTPGRSDQSPANMVWDLSGVPALLNAISQRAVVHLGDPCLTEIASAAVTVATSQAASKSIRLHAQKSATPVSGKELLAGFDRVEQKSLAALDAELERLMVDYQQRADRAHATFVDRATHSLIKHLEDWGEHVVWEYDPSGLRILLRSAHSLLGSRSQTAAKKLYEQAIRDIAELLVSGFGDAVEGIQIGIPDVPETPPPVALGQTIALDFNDGWWVNWWRRKRGYAAFAKQFKQLIASETEQFMVQMKEDQPAENRAVLMGKLQAEFDGYRNILYDLIENASADRDLKAELSGEDESRQREVLDGALTTLRAFAA